MKISIDIALLDWKKRKGEENKIDVKLLAYRLQLKTKILLTTY